MVEALTPNDLSKETVTVLWVPGDYDHRSQKSTNKQPMMSGYQTQTPGVQTFDMHGRPSDAQQDSDHNQ